jgi:putative heme-binding domain-containing protein
MADSGVREVPAAWLAAVSAALQSKDAAVLDAAVEAVRRLPVKREEAADVNARLLEVADHHDRPAALRLKALTAFAGDSPPRLSPELFSFLTARLTSDESATDRLEAARALGRAALAEEQLTALTATLKNVGPAEIDALLGAYRRGGNHDFGSKLVAALQESKGRKGLRADKLQPLLSKFGPEVERDAEPLLASLNPDAAKQRARIEQLLATLPEGDVRRGQLVFNSAKTGCAACHAIGYVGGQIGPDLTRVGQVRSRRDLLESIVYPSVSLVQSFEPVTVIVRRGENAYGIPRRSDAHEVELVTGPAQTVRVPASNVKEIRPGTVSIMPEGLDVQLSPLELADLLAFLGAARG